MVKGCILSIFTKKKQGFLQVDLNVSPKWMGEFRTVVFILGDSDVDKWKVNWGVRHVRLSFSLCLSEAVKVFQDLISLKWSNGYIQHVWSSDA